MYNVLKIVALTVLMLLLAACGNSDDQTVRDDSGNVIEGGEIGVFSLNLSDCFVDLPVGDVLNLEAVPCGDDHLYEIYHLFDVDMDEFDSAAIDAAAGDGCVDAFEGYMGVPFETSYYTFDALQPSAGSWEAGDREVVCFATPKNGLPLAGTARNAGLVDEAAITEPTTAPPAVSDDESSDTTTAAGVEQSVFELEVGGCYRDLAGGGQIETIEAVSCEEPHGLEVIALFDIDLPAFDRDEVSLLAEDGCLERFEPYMGISYERSWYGLDWLQPSNGSWEAGDREVVCLVFPYDETITESVGSAQGTARELGS